MIVRDEFGSWIITGTPKKYTTEENYRMAESLMENKFSFLSFDFGNPSVVFKEGKSFVLTPTSISESYRLNGAKLMYFIRFHYDIFAELHGQIRLSVSVNYDLEDLDITVKNALTISLENFLRGLVRDTDYSFIERGMDPYRDSMKYYWKYGFKYDESQEYDEKLDDLVPSSADLIEKDLETVDLTDEQKKEVRRLIEENRKLKSKKQLNVLSASH